MDKRISELVEWVAGYIKSYKDGYCPEALDSSKSESYNSHSWAKFILSHPDLALIVRRGTKGFSKSEGQTHLVIPLAEAIKEAQK